MPTTVLQPGSTNTSAVKQLQDWLVSQGYLTKAQVNTGYGVYGPQTTAAVAQLQKDMGVNTSGGGVGYFGPLTIAKLQAVAGPTASGAGNPVTEQASTAKIPTQTTSAPSSNSSSSANTNIIDPVLQKLGIKPGDTTYTPAGSAPRDIVAVDSTGVYVKAPPGRGTYWFYGTNGGGDVLNTLPTTAVAYTPSTTTTKTDTATTDTQTTGTGIAYDPSWSTYGITQSVWNSMNPTQQGVVAVSLGAAKSLYGANASAVTLSDALKAAATDPTLVAKYADMQALDTAALQQTIEQIQTQSSVEMKNKATEFENDRRVLSEQYAAAGAAYSGFRGKAQENLSSAEQGIVTSSRADLKKKLDDATAAFVGKYGSNAPGGAVAAQFVNPFSAAGTDISGLSITPNTNPETLTGNLPSGITGSAVTEKQADVDTLAGKYVTLGEIPKTKAITA